MEQASVIVYNLCLHCNVYKLMHVTYMFSKINCFLLMPIEELCNGCPRKCSLVVQCQTGHKKVFSPLDSVEPKYFLAKKPFPLVFFTRGHPHIRVNPCFTKMTLKQNTASALIRQPSINKFNRTENKVMWFSGLLCFHTFNFHA